MHALTRSSRTHRKLGQDKSLVDDRVAFRLYRRLFGTEDLHSHIRWAAVAPFVDLESSSTLEVGGGDGRMAFEVARAGHAGRIVISEFDPKSVAEARHTAKAGGFQNVMVSQDDLRTLSLEAKFEQVLAIDVLEHIDDDERAIQQISGVLRPGGQLVVSVPTPRYPEVFGQAFHDHLGHVRPGYWLEDLAPKLEACGLVVTRHRYYTGRAAARACRLFYGMRIPYVFGVLWAPLVRSRLLHADREVGDRDGASLTLVATRTESPPMAPRPPA